MGDSDDCAPGMPPALRVERRRCGAVSCLSAEERRKREDAVRFANASIALEGFKVSAAEQARSDRFIAGEIDLAEFLKGE